MPEWQYDKKDIRHSPSARDGLDFETECRFRKEGARFISDVGADLNLKHDTVATGCVYFHRFFMCHSFKDFERYVSALGCLFLAGKVEETPKKCRDMIRVARQRLNDPQFLGMTEDPREELMTFERVLLQTIKFDLQVDHPYQYLLKYAKILKGDQEKIQKMVQMAWTFINDSFCTSLCLQWEPEIIAIALMHLASRLSKFDITDWQGRNASKRNEKWWDQFVDDMSMELLEDVCHQVLDLYSNSTPGKEKQGGLGSSLGQPLGSSTSTPSPNSAVKTPKTPTNPMTPNLHPSTSALSTSATSIKPPSQLQPPLPATTGPMTPATMHQHSVSVPPPPPPNMAQQPSYAYAVQLQPPMPSGNAPPMPPMGPYPPGGPIYASYNYNLPPPAGGGAGSTMPPAYAVPAGYGPPSHYDYRSGHGAAPAYGAPSAIPLAYNVNLPPPPPPPGMAHMGYMHHQQHPRMPPPSHRRMQ